MKKLILSAVAAIAIVFSACNNQSKSSDVQESTNTEAALPDSVNKVAAVQYTCTMHPEVISDKPGKCPKCGMKLVEKKGSEEDNMQMDNMNHKH